MKTIPWFAAVGLFGIFCTVIYASATTNDDNLQTNPSLHLQKPAEIAYIPRTPGSLTFTKDIAPITAKHCASCHRSGEAAPFTLLNYEDVKKRGKQIVDVTHRRIMPPWRADSHGEFQGENRLSADQKGMIKQWVEEAMLEGSPKHLPQAPQFIEGWQLGKPDVELAPKKEHWLNGTGKDTFRTFLLPTNFPEDRFLSAVEIRPGNRAVVHHTILFVDTTGKFRRMAQQTGRMDFPHGGGTNVAEGVIDVWTPGKIPERLPKGVGIFLPQGADIVLEVHYHRTGKLEKDLTKVGLHFSNTPVQRRLYVQGLHVSNLVIPPGNANYEAYGEMPVQLDTTLISVFPHMHQIGKSIKVTLTQPESKEQTLVNVPEWDFKWQNTYRYKKPLKLQRGATLKLYATYDNSSANPFNPHRPPKRIIWGEDSTDEMGLVLFAFTLDAENLLEDTR